MNHNENLDQTILERLLKKLPEIQNSINLVYKNQEWEQLENILHKLYEGWCYTKCSDLINSIQELRKCIKKHTKKKTLEIENALLLAYWALNYEIKTTLAKNPGIPQGSIPPLVVERSLINS